MKYAEPISYGVGGQMASGGTELVLDVEGHFWDPAKPERRLRGRLHWDRRVGTLELEGLLRPAMTDELDVVAGVSLFGEPVCLIDCFVHRTEIGNVQHPQAWTVNRTLIGVDTPPAAVGGLELRIPSMRGFYGEPLVEFDRETVGPRDRVTISWTSSPELRVSLDVGMLVFDDDWRVSGPVADFSLRATPRARLLAPEPVPEESLRALIGPLLLLISICLDRTVEIEELRLLLAEGAEVRVLEGHRLLAPVVERDRPWLAIGNLDPLQQTFERWFGFCAEMPTAVAMLAEYLRPGAARPTEDGLLYLARFIEQFHRRRFAAESYRLPKAEFRARRRDAQERLGGELGQWVFDATEYANERSLAERLGQLVDLYGPLLSGGLGPDPDAFAQGVADTRNYYTHYSERLAEKAATGVDLIVMTERLWVLVRVCLLSEMGFTDDRKRELVALDSRLGWLSGQP